MINHGVGTPSRRVAPFGHTRITSCLPIPARFRGLPRPSSPPEAKASSVRPSFLPFCESLITPTGLPDGATALSFVCLREIAALNVFEIRKDLQSLLLLLSLCTLYFVLSASMRQKSLLRITSLIFSSIVKQLSVSPRFVPADSADKAV